MKIENFAQKSPPIATNCTSGILNEFERFFLIILKNEISFNYDHSIRLDELYKNLFRQKILFPFKNFDGLRVNENLLSQMD